MGFRRDDRVSHAQHGAGIVGGADDSYIVIAFDDGAVRKFVTKLVRLEHSNLPLPPKPPSAPSRPRRARVSARTAEHNGT